MQVVLLERVAKLGQMGDVVNVKDGYARNFLLPRKKALRATPENMAHFESQKAQLEARNLEMKKEAEQVAGKLDGESFVIIRQAGESGQLYGSVSARDIATAISDGGVTVERSQISMQRPIKTLGLHDERVVLHPEVSVGVVINVARSDEEAERQARGEDVTAQVDEDEGEETIAVEDVFEDEAQAQEALAEAEGGTDGDGDVADAAPAEDSAPEKTDG